MALASATPSSSTVSTATNTASTTTSHRTLTITLSTVFSVIGALLLVGIGFACWRRRRRRPLFPRGISPIDDDEIETWKVGQADKASEAGGVISQANGGEEGHGPSWPRAAARHWSGVSQRARAMTVEEQYAHQANTQLTRLRGISVDSGVFAAPPLRKSPSKVIIDEEPSTPRQYYSTSYGIPESAVTVPFPSVPDSPAAMAAGAAAASSWKHQHRQSDDLASPRTGRSARSLSLEQSARPPIIGRFSLDQDRSRNSALAQLMPQGQFPGTQLPAAVHARAPNSRPGLTDETIPGDPSFLPSPRPLRKQTSRLVKQPPMAVSGASSISGSHSFWHVRTRSGRSSSVASGRSLGSEVGLQQQSQHYEEEYEEVPPLPLAPIPSQVSQPHRNRSTSNLAQTNADGNINSSKGHGYLHHQHPRFYQASVPPQLLLDDDDNSDNQGATLGGLSPRPRVPDQSRIGRAIG
ncbi:hypothetical protein CMQ_8298 [Grosmannia clavigera kw1407]|uniref:Uncharacterized protein n=1 Tax=Grosmannia clavigera (strain kw1407 / UAMH 11150) TaxID=655863 RepID=F0XKV4_GROCL|nr:uncharacterized protein CMQ_8298 [Grosmannia clavigera kw1407]EFX01832.1 hypothetical protein CMQ_8298 [Grosmannia clavigera kw1407]